MGYDGVMRLAREHRYFHHPSGKRVDWLEIVKACYEAAAESRNWEFAGSRVFEKVGYESWFRNLKLLVTYGILKYEYSTRQKRRAHYTMPNLNGVARALHELRII